MAKKASADQAPESTPVKKTTTRKSSKSATKKTAEARETASQAAISSMAASAPSGDTPKPAKKTAAKPSRAKSPARNVKPQQEKATPQPNQQQAPSVAKEQASSNAPSSPQPRQPQQPIIQVRRESFRPKQQENSRHDESSPNEGFSQPETVGGGEPFSNNNRNKRRNRNRNNRRNDDRQEETRTQDNAPGYNKKLDLTKLSKRAWKIFLAEVTEEGLALMDDNTARETAKRSFRVAEFFMNEESRRKHPNDQQPRAPRPNQPQGSDTTQAPADKAENADQPSFEEN